MLKNGAQIPCESCSKVIARSAQDYLTKHSLAPEDLGEPDVGVREGDRQVLAPGDHAADPEVRLAEVDLDLAGQPSQSHEPLGVPAVALAGHLLAAALDVALCGGVTARVALLVAKPHVDPRHRAALPAPAPAVVVEPGVDRLLAWYEDLALGLAPPRGARVTGPPSWRTS